MYIFFSFLFTITTLSGNTPVMNKENAKPLEGIRIMIDPGHGDTALYDFFRVGPAGEREEWINLRVANYLKELLIQRGATVFMTRESDKDVGLGGRAALASIHKCDLFIAIHHNGCLYDTLDYPLVYFWGNAEENPASVDLALILVEEMKKQMTFEQQEGGSAYSDFLIYSRGTSVLRNTVALMPGIIGEGGFFTNPAGEKRLQSEVYNLKEAEVYVDALLKYAAKGLPKATPAKEPSDLFLEEKDSIQFKLQDGLGGHAFKEQEFKVLQGQQEVPCSWDHQSGILTVKPQVKDHKVITLRVFGRNQRGNALHPKEFHYKTVNYQQWHTLEDWKKAFEQGEMQFAQLKHAVKAKNTQAIRLHSEEALHFFRLSLELQHANPVARKAEVGILDCLVIQSQFLNKDLSEEIARQKSRLAAFYPIQTQTQDN
ncbi:MAG: hypothetical protein CR997_00730 [Acidobacteria bacterium]|nr:MAG: hypothetical protein CR997_00730 [Acidobacteriota bacterium]